VHITKDTKHKPSQFKPHIYTLDEVARYFDAVDSFDSPKNKKLKIQFPVLFRILYCCGTRINETLSIRKNEVDIDAGILKLTKTKNSRERYVVLGEELAILMRQYANKTFYLMDDDGYIFTSVNDSRLMGDSVYDYHREFLHIAGIPFRGGYQGPRLHDWRYTFSVYAFKQMIDSGMDMYVALPILSTYLGHKTIYATEHYYGKKVVMTI
jgi:integrase